LNEKKYVGIEQAGRIFGADSGRVFRLCVSVSLSLNPILVDELKAALRYRPIRGLPTAPHVQMLNGST